MNLLAILLGILNPLLVIPVTVSDYIRRHKPISCAMLLAGVMAYIAYFYQSRYIGDIERYMKLLSLYRDIPMAECFNRFYSGLYAFDFLFWICAKFSDERWLVVITSFLLYFNTFFVVLDYLKDSEEITPEYVISAIAFIFFLLPFYSYISSIRSSLSLSFGTLALYNEYIKGKKGILGYLLYALSLFFHLSGAFIVLVRFALVLKGKKRFIIWTAGGVMLALLGSGIFNSAKYFGGILSSISEKLIEYSAYGPMMNSRWYLAVRSSIATYVQKGICAAVLIIIIWNEQDENRKDESRSMHKRMSQIGVCISLIVLGILFFPTTFYLRFFTGLFPVILLSAFRTKGRHLAVSRVIIWGSTMGMLIIQLHTLFDNVNVNDFARNQMLGILNLFTF